MLKGIITKAMIVAASFVLGLAACSSNSSSSSEGDDLSSSDMGSSSSSSYVPLSSGPGESAENPILISTEAELLAFADSVNLGRHSYMNKYYALANDIAVSSGTSWTPIGSGSRVYPVASPFSGTFDGQGHTVSGISIDSDTLYVGFFGALSGATIKNLTVEGNIQGRYAVGGIAGYAKQTIFENVHNAAIVQASSQYAGGIVGYAMGGTAISASYNSGNIQAAYSAGGVAGILDSSRLVAVFNRGSVSATKETVGGFAGTASKSSSFNDCYVAASISSDSTLKNKGNIIGSFDGTVSVSNCYYDSDKAISLSDSVATGLPSAQMTVASFATMLNASVSVWTWKSGVNDGYPGFSWME
ncbi:MAG: hypothetical protein M0P13_05765 [Fibrobacteraceae bacterium]|nr:hypothetical protein [Fibrobacteraceae bacterium]